MKTADPRRFTQEEFVARARAVHGSKYDYSRARYENLSTKVEVVCPSHGSFMPTPRNHLHRASGCPGCVNQAPLTCDRFVELARAVHGDRYDYSLVTGVKNAARVRIACPTHGAFEQRVSDHLHKKAGCPACGRERTAASSRLTPENFVARARSIHGDAYDYSRAVYVNAMERVEIVCRTHGSFSQTPNSHLNAKQGCPLCGGSAAHTTETFIARSREVHGDRYGYEMVEYAGNKAHVRIVCPEHGEFRQAALHHMKGVGCPACSQSHGERAVRAVLDEHGIEYVAQWSHPTMVHVGQLKADFAVPSQRVLIEFDGEHHHRPVHFGGRSLEEAVADYELVKARDAAKDRWAAENGWQLVRLSDRATVHTEIARAGVVAAPPRTEDPHANP